MTALTFLASHGCVVSETVLDHAIRSNIHVDIVKKLKLNYFSKLLNIALQILPHNVVKSWPILYILVSFCKFRSQESQRAQRQPSQITGRGLNSSPKIGRKSANFQTLNGWRKIRNQPTDLGMVSKVLEYSYVDEKLVSIILFRPK